MAKSVTGIDVGQRTVKFLRGHYKGNTFHVADFAFFENPAAAGKVTGKVRKAGQPAAGATVTITDARGPEPAVQVTADEQGVFAAEGIQFGSARIVAKSRAGLSGAVSVTIAAARVPRPPSRDFIQAKIG